MRRFLILCACLGLGLVVGRPVVAKTCAPWPGEITPLPTVSSADPVHARWARIRAQELSQLARAVEPNFPLDAHGIWSHVLCLDPNSGAANEGLGRSRAVRVHQPEIMVSGSFLPTGNPHDVVAALELLDRKIPVSPEVSETAGENLDFSAADQAFSAAEQLMGMARFQSALGAASKARVALAPYPPTPSVRSRRTQVEVLSATAALALGREREARSALARAIQADADLKLDATTTSPKILKLLEEERAKVWGRRR